MDAFYASIEQRDQPELKGKPVIVGGRSARGVVCAASYEARVFGVHSAMPGTKAQRLCPNGIFLPVRMDHYRAVSRQLMEILHRFTPLVEKLSVDEAFLDVSGALHLFPDVAKAIKETVRAELDLTASVGVAPNKFLAKLASDMDKPDGLTRVPMDPVEIIDWLAPLPIERMWGVGAKTAATLHRHRIRTFADMQQTTSDHLRRVIGEKAATGMKRLAEGIDDRPVVTEREEKSMSSEHTFREDVHDPETLRQRVVEQAEKAGRRLRQAERVAGTVVLKLRWPDFTTLTRQAPLQPPTQSDGPIIAGACDLFDRMAAEAEQRGVRLLGVGVTKLREPGSAAGTAMQLDLFETTEKGANGVAEDPNLDAALDALREALGPNAVKRGFRS